MPIDIETFEERSDEHLGGGPSQPERVLSFLPSKADWAFRLREIAEEVDIPDNSIYPVLQRFKARDLIRLKGTYWASNIHRVVTLTHVWEHIFGGGPYRPS